MKKKTTADTPLFPELPPAATPPRRNRKKLGIPPGLDLDKYERDKEDGRLREIVGSWVRKKHSILENYVGYTRGVRKNYVEKFKRQSTFIDLFSGPGRVRIENTEDVLDGSSLLAWSKRGFGPFTRVYVADMHEALVAHCFERLQGAGAPVEYFKGEADRTVDEVIGRLDDGSYHFAFLDPFNLGSLSFDVIRKLATLKHMDILAHVSTLDLNRNLRLYIETQGSSLDRFAPGWRDVVDVNHPDEATIRKGIFEHWKKLVKTLRNMQVADAVQLISGDRGQPLYWLAFACRHQLGHRFWESMQPPAAPEQSTLFV